MDRQPDEPHPQVVEVQDTRQGRPGPRILAILIAAVMLTAIGFGIVWAFWMKPLSDGDANAGLQAVDSAAFKDGDRTPDASAPRTATGEPTNPPTGEAPNVNAPTVMAQPSDPENKR